MHTPICAKSKINEYEADIEVREVGYVVQIADGIAELSGLSLVEAKEMILLRKIFSKVKKVLI